MGLVKQKKGGQLWTEIKRKKGLFRRECVLCKLQMRSSSFLRQVLSFASLRWPCRSLWPHCSRYISAKGQVVSEAKEWALLLKSHQPRQNKDPKQHGINKADSLWAPTNKIYLVSISQWQKFSVTREDETCFCSFYPLYLILFYSFVKN